MAGHTKILAARVGAVAPLLIVSACSGPSVLDPRGIVGVEERQILFNSLAIMLAIVIPTIVATLAFAWWFRAGNARARFRPGFVYSGRIELVVWSIPTLVILFLGGIIWIGSHRLDPYAPLASATTRLEIQVVSLDWKWLFIYPEQRIATINQLVVPTGTPLHFSLTSSSVMNTFFVPQLGGMIYTMNGMRTQLYLQADHEGAFYGRSAQFSGDGFPGMEFTLRAVSTEDFGTWVKTTQRAGATLDRAEYARLLPQSMNLPPSTYRTVEARLFDAIVTQELPPGPGPGGPQADVRPQHGG